VKLDGWKVLRIGFHDVLPRLALVYVVMMSITEYLNTKLAFYPDRDIETTPRSAGLAYEDVSIPTADGLKLGAWYVPAEGALGTALFCHGNAGNISGRLETIAVLHELKLNVLIFDYRGYGRSEGRPTEEGTYLDAEAAWRWLVEARGVRPGRIVLHGRSLGGSVAAHLARDRAPAGLVVESTFANATDLAAELFPWLPVRWLSRLEYDTAAYAGGVTCPVMVIHSRDDELIPFHHGRRVFEAAPQPKRFLEIHGSHNAGFVESEKTYVPALRGFLADALGREGD